MSLLLGIENRGDLVGGVIVHDWIEKTGGAEYVLDTLINALKPEQVLSTWNDNPERFNPELVAESWLARSPLRGRKAASIPFLPNLWRNVDTGDAQWMLLSSHAFAHHARPLNRDIPKLGYIYSPARYVWFPEIDSRGSNPLVRASASVLKPVDRRRAQEMHSVVGISRHIANQIEAAWGIEAGVIYPPVDIDYFTMEHELNGADYQVLDSLPFGFILGASRFIPYKRLEIAIRLGELSGRPVVLAGDGPDRARLQALAAESSAQVTFITRPSRALLAALYRAAALFSFPAYEDFGIMPIEAMASGTPVLGLDVGGVSETVRDGLSGSLVPDFSDGSLLSALASLDNIKSKDCIDRSQIFSVQNFEQSIFNWVNAETG